MLKSLFSTFCNHVAGFNGGKARSHLYPCAAVRMSTGSGRETAPLCRCNPRGTISRCDNHVFASLTVWPRVIRVGRPVQANHRNAQRRRNMRRTRYRRKREPRNVVQQRRQFFQIRFSGKVKRRGRKAFCPACFDARCDDFLIQRRIFFRTDENGGQICISDFNSNDTFPRSVPRSTAAPGCPLPHSATA